MSSWRHLLDSWENVNVNSMCIVEVQLSERHQLSEWGLYLQNDGACVRTLRQRSLPIHGGENHSVTHDTDHVRQRCRLYWFVADIWAACLELYIAVVGVVWLCKTVQTVSLSLPLLFLLKMWQVQLFGQHPTYGEWCWQRGGGVVGGGGFINQALNTVYESLWWGSGEDTSWGGCHSMNGWWGRGVIRSSVR